ncbi:ABC transporter substrate-binding protein [Nocardioides sp. BP30]|uniref:ABC transporter substrate-binding protein n=1 Tax=Nocardioides sp. BP30 TaxID=3036374 RepID=UPI0024697F3F|nr:ABC transporter substrate-binding protein [Nocardioides sp. BP30]WGL53977.1 ABC transporter substrate-binding protein [Nocardioides sp. BP30]
MQSVSRVPRKSHRFARHLSLVVAGLLLGTTLTACGGSSSKATGDASADASRSAGAPATTISFQLDWVKNSQYSGFYEADNKGYYAADGLKVNILDGGNVSSTASVIAGGGAQLGIVSNMARLYDANKAGAGLVAVGAIYQTSPAGIMTLPSRKITDIDQLKGLRIGTDAGGKADINALFAANGQSPDWTFVPVGYDAAPLFKGQIDAYYCYVNSQPVTYDLKGEKSNAVTFADLGFQSYAGLIVTTKSYLDSHRQVVADFLADSQKGWADALADPAGAVALTIGHYGKGLGLEQDSELGTLKAQVPLMESTYTKSHGLLAMDPSAITGAMADALKATGRTNIAGLPASYNATLLPSSQASQ